MLAGILSSSSKARWIDIPVGLLLLAFGLNFFRSASRVAKEQATSVSV